MRVQFSVMTVRFLLLLHSFPESFRHDRSQVSALFVQLLACFFDVVSEKPLPSRDCVGVLCTFVAALGDLACIGGHSFQNIKSIHFQFEFKGQEMGISDHVKLEIDIRSLWFPT